jgi:hypothetical protein
MIPADRVISAPMMSTGIQINRFKVAISKRGNQGSAISHQFQLRV